MQRQIDTFEIRAVFSVGACEDGREDVVSYSLADAPESVRGRRCVYGIYRTLPDGTQMHVADCPALSDAQAVLNALQRRKER